MKQKTASAVINVSSYLFCCTRNGSEV